MGADVLHLAETNAIAALLGVKPGTMRVLAHRHPDLLPKRGTRGGRTLYAVEDAERFAARRPDTPAPSHKRG